MPAQLTSRKPFAEDLERWDAAAYRHQLAGARSVQIGGLRVEVSLTATTGRARTVPLWLCPECGSPARVLFTAAGVKCRKCAGLRYRSQSFREDDFCSALAKIRGVIALGSSATSGQRRAALKAAPVVNAWLGCALAREQAVWAAFTNPPPPPPRLRSQFRPK